MSIVPFTPEAPDVGEVVYDDPAFVLMYPEFAGLSPVLRANGFVRAEGQVNNTCGSIVTKATFREMLLGLVTAHIIFIMYGTNDGSGNIAPPLGIVGRVSSATEGSVAVAAEYGVVPGNDAYYQQTKYGVEFLQLTRRFKSAVYVAPSDCSGFPYTGNGEY